MNHPLDQAVSLLPHLISLQQSLILLCSLGRPFTMLLTLFFTALLVFTQAAPAPTSEQLGIKFDERGNDLPTITLPYGTWRAAKYISDGDIYVFKNIRFAAPPVGNLRWAKPAPPQNVDGVQDGSYGPVCMQAAPAKGLNFLGPGNNSPVGSALNQFLAGIPVALFNSGAEDCLFLDVYVPGKAVRNPGSYKLPVVVWLYGGAYCKCNPHSVPYRHTDYCSIWFKGCAVRHRVLRWFRFHTAIRGQHHLCCWQLP